MFFRALFLSVLVAAAAPTMAQEGSLEVELAEIERQIAEVEQAAERYDGGLIVGLIEARREALLLARTLIENRMNAEAGAATVEVIVPAIQPDEARAEQILGEMAAAQERIAEAEREVSSGGGLV